MMWQVRALSQRVCAAGPTVIAVALAAALLLAAACSSHTKRPEQLGDCVPIGGATCPTPAGGAAGAAADGGLRDAADASVVDVVSCSTLLTDAASPNCDPCVTASCCQAATACALDPQCASLVLCVETQNCAVGATTCATPCVNLYPGAATAYADLASCVAASCPECPSLPMASVSDL